jgi:cysteine desulfurase
MRVSDMQVYLDNIATTKTDPIVTEEMNRFISEYYGNASSIHHFGTKASAVIEKTREIIASSIHASPEEIFFTSGGTESNNWALKGIFSTNHSKGNHIIVSAIEHPSIIETARWLTTQNAEVTYLPVDNKGFISLDNLRSAIRKNTILVSVMHANNEVGTIEPIEEIGRICSERKIYFHTDACQTYTKTDINVQKQNINLATINAHKIYGPKGVGALYVKRGTPIEVFMHGGGQENGWRSGTYNTPGIVGFGKAVEIADKNDITKIRALRDYFIAEISKRTDGIVFFGPADDSRLCNNINLGFNGVAGKNLFLELNKRNVIISVGSACSSTKLTPSYVLTAMGIDDETAHTAVRIGLSKWTFREELDKTISYICEIIKEQRNEEKG